jgi:16S rRNA (cytidine1402-2'-O)-methyltransferase
MDVLPQTVKGPLISLIITLLRTTKQHATIKGKPEKNESELVLFTLNKHRSKERLDFIKPLLEGKNMGLMRSWFHPS